MVEDGSEVDSSSNCHGEKWAVDDFPHGHFAPCLALHRCFRGCVSPIHGGSEKCNRSVQHTPDDRGVSHFLKIRRHDLSVLHGQLMVCFVELKKRLQLGPGHLAPVEVDLVVWVFGHCEEKLFLDNLHIMDCMVIMYDRALYC